MSSDDIAIRVSHLGKCYAIYDAPRDRLKQFILPRLQRLAGQRPRQYYREFHALNDVSFQVSKGETVGIIGRNGSGKSTLLQIICGTLSPTVGTVETRGRIAALLELGSGFNHDFSGRENIYLNASVLGLNNEEINARFEDIVAFADIGEFIEQPVKTYSSGMVVRLAFAVQATVEPDILVVDEALAVGDERFQRKCFARLEALKAQGTSVLLVSHSAQQVIELCDRALLLEHGECQLVSDPPEVVQLYQRLIYAPAPAVQGILAELKPPEPPAGQSNDTPIDQSRHAHHASVAKDFFDPELVPSNTISYPQQGAEISEFKVFNANGEEVNVLVRGKDYRLVCRGTFIQDCRSVHFGIHFRLATGHGITGQRFPGAGESIAQVHSGRAFEVTYHFRMLLAPGCYFIGGGIWSQLEPTCLHRVLDMAMIRVLPVDRDRAFGYFDASCGESTLAIS